MKKITKYSIALVSTTLLTGNSGAQDASLNDNTSNIANFTQPQENSVQHYDAYLSKIPTDLLINRSNLRSIRATGDTGSSGDPSSDPTIPVDNGVPEVEEEGTGSTVASGQPPIMSLLSFVQLSPHYKVGDRVNVAVNLLPDQMAEIPQRVDLWVAITIPGVPDFFFFTGSAVEPAFSTQPEPFLTSLETAESNVAVLDFLIPPGIGGEYTFYALLVSEGSNPLEGTLYNRSNLAVQSTVLDNE